MPEARERKQSDKIKRGSKSDKKPVKNDVRRQMTAKLQKEFIERKKNHDTGGDTSQTAEVQAANTVETEILTSADSIQEHTGDAVPKSIAHYKRKIQDKKQHKEPPPGEMPPVDTGPIPLHEVEALARVLLPEIQRFFESEEGQQEFRAWKERQNKK